MNKTIIFDVNETLLELSPLKKSINSAFEHENAADIWFAELLQYSLVESITHSYHDFSEIAAAVLKMNAQKWNKDFSDKEIEKILSPITKLSAYPDVKTGLNKLKNAGYKLIAFSNGKPSVLKKQLDYAGLSEYFDKILSVDSVKKYKPHPDAYKYAVNIAGVDLKDVMMVAAHGWDITGAMRAGLETVFIQRPGKSLFPLAQKPTFETANIETLSKILLGSKS
ncbi:MAG: haloacid dehalogenase type II [Christiangramia sp.]